MFDKLKSAFSLWNLVRGKGQQLVNRQAVMRFLLVIIGDESEFEQLCRRLEAPAGSLRIDRDQAIPDGEGVIVLDAGRLLVLDPADFTTALGRIAVRHADRRIALASKVPAFRPVVVRQLSHDMAYENARAAALSALPGVIPLTDWLLPATSAGDLYVLTKNQIQLLLQVAAVYGRPPQTAARLKELLPVVGASFGWRALVRELVGLVPGGVGLAVKAAVAYAGTYSVGLAAGYYYAGNGRKMSIAQFREAYREGFADAIDRVRALLPGK